MNKKRVILSLAGIVSFFILRYLILTFSYEEKFSSDLLALAGSLIFFVLGTFSIKDEVIPTYNTEKDTLIYSDKKLMSQSSCFITLLFVITGAWLLLTVFFSAFNYQFSQLENARLISSTDYGYQAVNFTVAGLIFFSSTVPIVTIFGVVIGHKADKLSFWLVFLSVILSIGILMAGNFYTQLVTNFSNAKHMILTAFHSSQNPDLPFLQDDMLIMLFVVASIFIVLLFISFYIWVCFKFGSLIYKLKRSNKAFKTDSLKLAA